MIAIDMSASHLVLILLIFISSPKANDAMVDLEPLDMNFQNPELDSEFWFTPKSRLNSAELGKYYS